MLENWLSLSASASCDSSYSVSPVFSGSNVTYDLTSGMTSASKSKSKLLLISSYSGTGNKMFPLKPFLDLFLMLIFLLLVNWQ